MGMKFLNKKGWHTGSLRNIENVWKAEQKHEQEQKKLEELRKQIVEERERAEFRQLQEQAGLVPRQERLDFLYDSGLAVGKSSDGFKTLEAYPKAEESSAAVPSASASAAEQSSTPGALFEVKPQSANDAWRKLHSDPLLMIRQREQEALARIRNNPVKMAMIRRSVEESKNEENSSEKKKKKKKHGEKKSSHKKNSSRTRHSDDKDAGDEDTQRGTSLKKEIAGNGNYASVKPGLDSEDVVRERGIQRENRGERKAEVIYEKGSRHHRDDRGRSDSEEEVKEKGTHRKNDRERREKEIYDKGSRHYRGVRREPGLEEEVRERGGKRMIDRESRVKHIDGMDSGRYRDVGRGWDSEEEYRKSKGTHNVYRESRQYRDVRRDSDISRERDHQKGSENKYDHSDGHIRNTEDYNGDGPKSEKSLQIDHSSLSRSDNVRQETKSMASAVSTMNEVSSRGPDPNPQNRRKKAPKLSEEERAARLREMQLDAEVHEEQRWKRLKKADEDDAREAALAAVAKGKNFLEVAKKNVYGAEQGGSATIEESVRRRSHYLQGTAHGLYAIDSRLILHQVAPHTNMSDMLAQDEARAISLNSRLRPDNHVQPQSPTISVKPGLSIGSGNYYVKIGLGTPTKYYAMLLDTGSSFSWLQCLPCQYCHPQSDQLFNPSASRSYKTISCSSPACDAIQDATLNDPACDFSSGHCIYTASYGDSSFSVGVLSQDVLSLTPSSSVTRFLYGCGNDNMGQFGKAAGLLGLGRHTLSLISQMSSKHGSTFSYCLPSYSLSTPHGGLRDSGGFLSVGNTAATDGKFKYTPMIRNSLEPSLYFLKLTSITVAGQSLGVTAAAYRAPTIIDSGTVVSRLPSSIYNNLKQSFIKLMTTHFNYKQAPAFSILDTCFITKSKAVQKAPLVQMIFAGGATLSLGPQSALIQVAEDITCLAFASSGTTGGLVIIGNHQQQTFEVVYDASMSRIGFSPHGCN